MWQGDDQKCDDQKERAAPPSAHVTEEHLPYLSGEITGFSDVPVSLLFQLKDDLSLLLSLISVVLDLFLQVPLGLLMELYQFCLFLGRIDGLENILKIITAEQLHYSKCLGIWG